MSFCSSSSTEIALFGDYDSDHSAVTKVIPQGVNVESMASQGKSTDLLAQNLDDFASQSPGLDKIAKDKGIPKSTFRTLRKGLKSCRLETLDLLAETVGAEPWTLIHPNAPAMAPHVDAIEEILTTYLETSDAGRQTIINAVIVAKTLRGAQVVAQAPVKSEHPPPKRAPESSRVAAEVGESDEQAGTGGARDGRRIYGVVEGAPERRTYAQRKRG